MRLIRTDTMLHLLSLLIVIRALTAADSAQPSRLRRHRGRKRGIRQIMQDAARTADVIGERNCTEEEERKQGCLAGRCIAKVQSQIHTFIICSCPSDRRGARCEEVNIDIEGMATQLQKLEADELCKQERYDLLLKSVGYESRFLDCIKKNYGLNLNIKDKKETKQQRRERKRKEREKKRRKKLRRRQKKKERKRLRTLKRRYRASGTDYSSSPQRESSEISAIQQRLLASNSSFKQSRDSNRRHSIRHVADKIRSQDRLTPITVYLAGTPTPPSLSNHTASSGSS